MTESTAPRRLGGLVLVLFGLAGLGLVLATAWLLLGALTTFEETAADLERQRTEVVAILGPASDALSSAATAAANASASLTETETAARDGATLTSRMAVSFEGMASLGTLNILGVRPFAGVAAQFADVGAQSRALSADLTAAADSIAANIADSQAVAEDLRALAAQLDRLEASVGATNQSSDGTALSLDQARFVFGGLLAWLGLLALGIAAIGLRRFVARSPEAPR